MLIFFKRYKTFIIVFFLQLILIWILAKVKFILIDPKEMIPNVIVFVSNWILISLIIYKFNYLKAHRKVIVKTLGLLLMLALIVIVDDNMKMADNPLTLFLIVCFYMVIFYTISPQIFKKHKYYIIGFYILALLYFAYIRLNSEEVTYLLQKKNIILGFLIPIPIIISLWIYEQWKWFKNLNAEKVETELTLLKVQVNPHFFFNTLNNLHALTLKKHEKAPEVVLKLSHIMRYTIYEGKKDIVFLRDEIMFIENYIELHKIRYHKNVKINFSHSINNNDNIAPLLFIILVENAFKHGVEKLTENAFITINLESNSKNIHFTIQNNFDLNEYSSQKGIGLNNLKRRLNLIYPKKHNLVIEQVDSVYKSDLKIQKND